MDESNRELENKFMIDKLITHVDYLAKRIVEMEVQFNEKGKYTTPHARIDKRKMRASIL